LLYCSNHSTFVTGLRYVMTYGPRVYEFEVPERAAGCETPETRNSNFTLAFVSRFVVSSTHVSPTPSGTPLLRLNAPGAQLERTDTNAIAVKIFFMQCTLSENTHGIFWQV
jgi:hypothetical protein